ncbi:ankyrin repeat domain-containing protein 34B [Alosa alosa]|uniref:ankyrin repeat domain-containing protein 34B n=1 Tax=Alosa alosa TaxID=278164 RepID=UPI0020154DD1|nr:ankyrin repeat domain-containing protein 34B [Alosa alosa]
MAEPQEYLSDGSPLITAAQQGKLRLVRLLLEGGAQVNESNQRGETPLLVACKAMRGDQSGCSVMLKLVRFLLKHGAEPNVQDKTGRTALMYACIERAGVEVASTLIVAGADPSMEDYSGASALVYTINSQQQETLRVLLDACRAKGRDIIIIATDLSPGGGAVTRRYLNVPPSPDSSPVSCMSPSDIELKTGSPGSEADGGNIFNFRAVENKRGSRGAASSPGATGEIAKHQRLRSEPWLAVHNLAHLKRAYEEGLRKKGMQEEEEEDTKDSMLSTDIASSLQQMSLTTVCSQSDLHSSQTPHGKPDTGRISMRGSTEKLSVRPGPQVRCGRRNTLPSLAPPPLLQLPPLTLNYSRSDSYLQNQLGLHAEPRPLSSASSESLSVLVSDGVQMNSNELPSGKKPLPGHNCGVRPQTRVGSFLPPLPVNRAKFSGCSVDMPLGPNMAEPQPHGHCQWQRKFSRRHSVQLEDMGHSGSTEEYIYVL